MKCFISGSTATRLVFSHDERSDLARTFAIEYIRPMVVPGLIEGFFAVVRRPSLHLFLFKVVSPML